MHAYVHTRIRTRGRECVLHARVAAVGTTCLPASPASSPTRLLLRPSSPCLHASLLPCLSAPASLDRLPPSIPRCQTVTEGSFRELEKKALRAFFLLPPLPLPPGLPSPLPPFPLASLPPGLPSPLLMDLAGRNTSLLAYRSSQSPRQQRRQRPQACQARRTRNWRPWR